jgi:transcriptional regulator with XRE-family HTH domain
MGEAPLRGHSVIVIDEQLRGWRQRRALSQAELAARAGVAEPTVVRIEGGKPTRPSTLRRLADALGLSPGELIDGPPTRQAAAVGEGLR